MREGQFEADRKEQQRHAEFRQRLDLVRTVDQCEAVRSDDDPGREEPDQRRSVETVCQANDRDGKTDQQEQVTEESDFWHVSDSLLRAGRPLYPAIYVPERPTMHPRLLRSWSPEMRTFRCVKEPRSGGYR